MNDPPATMFLAGRIPLPTAQPTAAPFSQAPPHGILKKPTVTEPPPEKRPEAKKKEPAGCPPGPPPDLHDMRELDSDYEDEEPPKSKKAKTIRFSDETKSSPDIDRKSDDSKKDDATKAVEADVPKPTSLQQRMLAISGQNIDEFMKEMENVHKKKELERAADLQERLSTLEKDKKDESEPSDCMCGVMDARLNVETAFYLLFPISAESSSTEEEDEDDDDGPEDDETKKEKNEPPKPTPPIPSQAIKLPSGPPPPPVSMPPAMMFRPPPLRPNMSQLGMRMPPGKIPERSFPKKKM